MTRENNVSGSEGALPQYEITPLTAQNIPIFRQLIQQGIAELPFLTPEEQEEQIGKRTAEYYQEGIDHPQDWSLLCAQDADGNIVGSLEAKTVDIQGQQTGYVHWVCVDQSHRGRGVASSLYTAYEKLLKKNPDIHFMLAHVHHGNTASMKLHQRHGLTDIFSENERGAWYYKDLHAEQ